MFWVDTDAPFDGGRLLRISFDGRMGPDNLFESTGYHGLLCTNAFLWSILMSSLLVNYSYCQNKVRHFLNSVSYASTSGIQFTDAYEAFDTLLQLFHGWNRSLIVYTNVLAAGIYDHKPCARKQLCENYSHHYHTVICIWLRAFLQVFAIFLLMLVLYMYNYYDNRHERVNSG